MGVHHEWLGDGVIVRFAGDHSILDLMQHASYLFGSDRAARIKFVVVDLTSVETFSVTEEELKDFAAMESDLMSFYDKIFLPVRIAVVTTNERAISNFRVFAENMASGLFHGHIFTNFDDGLNWAAVDV